MGDRPHPRKRVGNPLLRLRVGAAGELVEQQRDRRRPDIRKGLGRRGAHDAALVREGILERLQASPARPTRRGRWRRLPPTAGPNSRPGPEHRAASGEADAPLAPSGKRYRRQSRHCRRADGRASAARARRAARSSKGLPRQPRQSSRRCRASSKTGTAARAPGPILPSASHIGTKSDRSFDDGDGQMGASPRRRTSVAAALDMSARSASCRSCDAAHCRTTPRWVRVEDAEDAFQMLARRQAEVS